MEAIGFDVELLEFLEHEGSDEVLTGFLPTKAHAGDAGLDLYAPTDFVLKPGDVLKVPLRIATEFPEGWCAVVKDRSGLGSRGVHALAGVIDHSYRGEWAVVLANLSDREVLFRRGDRIAQALLVPVPAVAVRRVDRLGASERGAGGFGSTGN